MPGMGARRIIPLVATLAAGIVAVVVSTLLWDGGSNASGVDWSVGAIALVDFDRAIYRSSAGVEVTLERIRGPVVTQPCS